MYLTDFYCLCSNNPVGTFFEFEIDMEAGMGKLTPTKTKNELTVTLNPAAGVEENKNGSFVNARAVLPTSGWKKLNLKKMGKPIPALSQRIEQSSCEKKGIIHFTFDPSKFPTISQ